MNVPDSQPRHSAPESDRLFAELLVRSAENQLSESESRQLNAMLAGDEGKRKVYVTFCLQRRLMSRGGALDEQGWPLPSVAAALESQTAATGVGRRLAFPRVAAWAAVAAVLAVGVTLFILAQQPAAPTPAGNNTVANNANPGTGPGAGVSVASPAIATLTQTIDAVWAAQSHAVGERLGRGFIRLESGIARIEFANGACVAIEGPVELEIKSDKLAVLHRGRLSAKVPDAAQGFTIDTPSMNVVDLGTAFGVSVDATGDTNVAVFEGKVAVAPAKRKRKQTLLTEGRAVRAKVNDADIQTVAFNGQPFARTWPITSGVLQTTGVVRFVEPPPPQYPHRYEDDDDIVVFLEREGVTLGADAPVNMTEPGEYHAPFSEASPPIAAGERVRVYLLQFNPVGRPEDGRRQMAGTVTFDQPILGLIVSDKLLLATDDMLGAVESAYSVGGRGLESRDVVVLSEDRRTLRLDWFASLAADQMRVLVAAPQPGPATASATPVRP